MPIESKEWWDVIHVYRGVLTELGKDIRTLTDELTNEKCASGRMKLKLRKNRSPHSVIHATLGSSVKCISIIDTNVDVKIRKGGLVRWEGNALQYTDNIEIPPINFVVSKVENAKSGEAP